MAELGLEPGFSDSKLRILPYSRVGWGPKRSPKRGGRGLRLGRWWAGQHTTGSPGREGGTGNQPGPDGWPNPFPHPPPPASGCLPSLSFQSFGRWGKWVTEHWSLSGVSSANLRAQSPKTASLSGGNDRLGGCCCSVAQSCLTLCDPLDCSTPSLSFTISQSLLKPCPSNQWCSPTISSSVALFSFPQSFPATGSFPISRLFHLGDVNVMIPYQLPMLRDCPSRRPLFQN